LASTAGRCAAAAQGTHFTETVIQMTDNIARLGPLEWRDTVDDLAPVTPELPEVEEVSHA
jgi:hypothetical protein